MKVILFCQNAYAFGIMKPLRDVLSNQGHSYVWYITPKLKDLFPFQEDPVTQSIQELNSFKSDAIICLLYTSPSPRDKRQSRMPSSA